MDKNAIKKYAIWARRELISRVSQKALQYGITDKDIVPTSATSVNGVVLSAEEMKQRKALIERINAKGYEQVMEEVAYTWFNRFIALRFMEVNGYLPSHIRVFTDENNAFRPQILTEAISLEMAGLDMEKVYDLKDTNDDDGLFKYLIIVQCNALSPILPGMFQRIDDYTELLFPDNLLREGSVIEQMVSMIPEEDWKDAVQIIGWLYQYYNSEKKDEVFAALKKNVKITKENIPAATQLFTPDWIVRYMVENSLGRLWIEHELGGQLSNLSLRELEGLTIGDIEHRRIGPVTEADLANKFGWKYYLPEAQQEPEVQAQLTEIRKEYASMKPEQIKVIDPCAGSGHILAYLFDVLVQIYEAYGYTTREAVRNIIENNIYGLDIDDRAAQLAYFSVMMKARQYDRRFLTRKDEEGKPDVPQPHVYAVCESNSINRGSLKYFGWSMSDIERNMALSQLTDLLDTMRDAKEYGSILIIRDYNWELLYRFVGTVDYSGQLDFDAGNLEDTKEKLWNLVEIAATMAQKYDVAVTNPPYMGSANMSAKLFEYIMNNYADYKSDLFAAFILRVKEFTNSYGLYALITQQAWMFKSSYRILRPNIYQNVIVNMLHLGPHAFDELSGEVVQTVAFVQGRFQNLDYTGRYLSLEKFGSEESKRQAFLSDALPFTTKAKSFMELPNQPAAYWVSDKQAECFAKYKSLARNGITACAGLNTSDNDRFVRFWHEVGIEEIGFGCKSHDELVAMRKKYALFNKGGGYRKWYGNQYYVIAFNEENYRILSVIGNHLPSRQYYFQPCLTWNRISSAENFSVRICESGFVFDDVSPSAFMTSGSFAYTIGLMNSKPFCKLLCVMNRGMKTETGNVQKVPYAIKKAERGIVEKISNCCIQLAKNDWDVFETSWDFKQHPLVALRGNYEDAEVTLYQDDLIDGIVSVEFSPVSPPIQQAYEAWERLCDNRFDALKANEEELNRIFIDIYGLQDELTPEVDNKDVTVRKADLGRDIRSFISYAVGCMFGRYSLDEPGLAYAGGVWDADQYKTFPADPDNIIPICDDEYFEDDIVGRFVKFVETVYGAETLDENLKFIAGALGGKGQPRDVIRNYFLNDFFKDHCKIYQKRPIYWLFDSGKKGGFRALIYLHRYQPDTIARMRTDYVHEQQARYRTTIADLEQRIASASTSERVKLNKRLKTLKDQATEIQGYEEKIHHLADQYIAIDLDDGVKVNYAKFQDVLAKIK